MITSSLVPSLLYIYVATIVVLLGWVANHQKSSPMIIDVSRLKSRIILLLSLIMSVFTTAYASARGYDVKFFSFVTTFINKYGWLNVFRTDKPLFYIPMALFHSVTGAPSEVCLVYWGLVLGVLLTASVFVFAHELTGNSLVAGMSAILVSQSNIFLNYVVNFMPNLLGLSLTLLFLSCVIKMRRQPRFFYPASLLFLGIALSHLHSMIFLLLVLGLFTASKLLRGTEKPISHLTILLSLCLVMGLLVFFIIPIYSTIVLDQLTGASPFISFIPSLKFLSVPNIDWASEEPVFSLLSLLGLSKLFTLDEDYDVLKIYVLTVFALFFFSGKYYGRMFILIPFSVLGGLGLMEIMRRVPKIKWGWVIILVLVFNQSWNVFYDQRITLSRYGATSNEYDLKFPETASLVWVSRNYDLDSVVVITNKGWSPHGYGNDGLHYRILDIVGNNVYFGDISDLLSGLPDDRGSANGYLGFYSSLGVDWSLPGKTIIVDTRIYDVKVEDEPHLIETAMVGVYVYDVGGGPK